MFQEQDKLAQTARNAVKLMRDSGFEIKGKIEVTVDSRLPFMGYATQRRSGHVIVVSGMALKSGLVEGLLIHEMCHIYRTENNHPSHSSRLLNPVGMHVIHENELSEDYQIRIIQQAVNHVQDIYADDLSFKVFEKSQAFTPEQAHSFFLEWINDNPLKERSSKDRWQNIGIMLNNCFAISNLARHGIPDLGSQAERAVQKFLSQVDDRIRNEFAYLRNFMTNLEENPAPQQFEKDLTEYLTRITRLTKRQASY